MEVPYDIIYEVLLVLASAVFLGGVFEHFGLPAVAGELLSGLILGPTLLGVVTNTTEAQGVSTIAIFFIVFLIGLEMKTEIIRKYIIKGTATTLTSFVVPFVVATVVAIRLFPFGVTADLVVALVVVVPSISIVSAMVIQYKLLELQTGQVILASVIICDVLAFVVLAALSQSAQNLLYIFAFIAVFVVVFAAIDWLLNTKVEAFQLLLRSASHLLRRENVSYAILIVVGLLVSYLFQAVGLSYIIGAFFAGLILHEGLIGREAFGRVSRTFTRMNEGFFIPIFFGFAGVEANLLAAGLPLLGALAVVAGASIATSLLLTYKGATSLWKASGDEARDVAVILGGRGAVGIVIATVAVDNGIIDLSAYSLAVFGTMAISIFVPLLIKRR
ncbi:MAG: cation:proton antiporter [Nitrososphaerota archaeon]|nr:cation:proton antiporter [Nitrososphaerota archaeon]